MMKVRNMNAFVFNGLAKKRLSINISPTSQNRCIVTMRKGSRSNKSESQGSTPGKEAKIPNAMEDTLLEDIKSMRAKTPQSSETEQGTTSAARVKSLVESILLWDFFLVLGLLGWLVVALVPHFVSKNDVLLDPWLALWQPFIQPVLGVLMLGTIVQGTMSFISKK